jgi:prevent-host-death family protein
MNSVGLAELRERLSAYLKKVKSGQEVLITERGVPIARLAPLTGAHEGRKPVELPSREGTPNRSGGKVRDSLCSPPTGAAVGESVLAALLSERDEGR